MSRQILPWIQDTNYVTSIRWSSAVWDAHFPFPLNNIEFGFRVAVFQLQNCIYTIFPTDFFVKEWADSVRCIYMCVCSCIFSRSTMRMMRPLTPPPKLHSAPENLNSIGNWEWGNKINTSHPMQRYFPLFFLLSHTHINTSLTGCGGKKTARKNTQRGKNCDALSRQYGERRFRIYIYICIQNTVTGNFVQQNGSVFCCCYYCILACTFFWCCLFFVYYVLFCTAHIFGIKKKQKQNKKKLAKFGR